VRPWRTYALVLGVLLGLGCGSVGPEFALPAGDAAPDSSDTGSAADAIGGGEASVVDSGFGPADGTVIDAVAPPDTAPDSAVVLADSTTTPMDSGVALPDTALIDSPPSFDGPISISVAVTGLASGDSVVLQDNGGPSLTVSMNGTAAIEAAVVPGTPYAITVTTQPSSPPQTCTVSNGVGTAESNVASVTVACVTDSFSIGGMLDGLTTGGTVVLQDNGGNNLPLSANGPFTFATPVNSASPYGVTVLTQPVDQQCTVTHGAGTVGAAAVLSVIVTCATPNVTVGGVLTGLAAGNSVVLQDDGGDSLTLTSNGMFMFSAPVADGTLYEVTVSTQPSPQTQACTVSAGMGTVGATNVTGVLVNCMAGTVTLGGTLSGLAPTSVIALSNNAGPDTNLTTNGPFVLPTPVPIGASYAITVHGQPLGETCSVTLGAGTTGTTNVSDIVVTCVSLLSGTVTGLPAGETLTALANGTSTNVSSASLSSTPFSLRSTLVPGQAYAISVGASPTSPISVSCVVTANATGTIGTSAGTSLAITCTPASCADLLAETPGVASGIYAIYPQGAAAPFQGYCDMLTDGGGWLLVGRSQPGGWTPACVGTDGANDFGWQTSRGSLTDDTQAYSLNVATAGVTSFTQLLFGNYSAGKQWGSRVFVQTLPANWLTTYTTTDVEFAALPTEVSVPACVPLPTPPDNGSVGNTGAMFLRGGYTSATYGFQLRDVPGGQFGLMASGWATCYGEDSSCYGGGINGAPGMMMVR